MNQKSWAIISVAFLAGIMVLSPFAGFVMRGGEHSEEGTSDTWSLSDFGMESSRLIDWDFEGIGDILGIYPENLTFAYWIDMTASQNLTDTASQVLPPSVGMTSREELYPSKIERVSWGIFDDEWAEFHWIKPYWLGSYGLAIPYNGYLMIPINTELFAVMGMPTLFGPQQSLEVVLDVISRRSLSTDKFILPYDETGDLQISCLGLKSMENPNFTPPLGGEYQEFYLGVSQDGDEYMLTAICLSPSSNTEQRVRGLAENHSLKFTSYDDMVEVTGVVYVEDLKDTLGALLAP
ncbi:MAG: hypothetical protein ACXQT4_03065 [Methanotrichaceae archaeon]